MNEFDEAWLDHEPEEDEGLAVGGALVHETEKAVLWRCTDGTEAWLPKSQIIRRSDAEVTITSWLADQRGWAEEMEDDDIPF